MSAFSGPQQFDIISKALSATVGYVPAPEEESEMFVLPRSISAFPDCITSALKRQETGLKREKTVAIDTVPEYIEESEPSTTYNDADSDAGAFPELPEQTQSAIVQSVNPSLNALLGLNDFDLDAPVELDAMLMRGTTMPVPRTKKILDQSVVMPDIIMDDEEEYDEEYDEEIVVVEQQMQAQQATPIVFAEVQHQQMNSETQFFAPAQSLTTQSLTGTPMTMPAMFTPQNNAIFQMPMGTGNLMPTMNTTMNTMNNMAMAVPITMEDNIKNALAMGNNNNNMQTPQNNTTSNPLADASSLLSSIQETIDRLNQSMSNTNGQQGQNFAQQNSVLSTPLEQKLKCIAENVIGNSFLNQSSAATTTTGSPVSNIPLNLAAIKTANHNTSNQSVFSDVDKNYLRMIFKLRQSCLLFGFDDSRRVLKINSEEYPSQFTDKEFEEKYGAEEGMRMRRVSGNLSDAHVNYLFAIILILKEKSKAAPGKEGQKDGEGDTSNTAAKGKKLKKQKSNASSTSVTAAGGKLQDYVNISTFPLHPKFTFVQDWYDPLDMSLKQFLREFKSLFHVVVEGSNTYAKFCDPF